MSKRIHGSFEVKLTPLPAYNTDEGCLLGRMSIDKQFYGDLDATSKGEMLTAMTAVKGSATYVAIELVTGSLGGCKGTFVLHHTGVMDRGTPHLTVKVVSDSGTGELVGLTGTMQISMKEGEHSYEMEYALPADGTEGDVPPANVG